MSSKKTSPRPDAAYFFGHPALLSNVRSRSLSLFLRVVFSRKAAVRAVRISEFVFLPSGFISVVVTAPISYWNWQASLLLNYRGGNAWSYLRLVAYSFFRLSKGA